MNKCSVEGCKTPLKKFKHLCDAHYGQARKEKHIALEIQCVSEGCTNLVVSGKICDTHREKARRQKSQAQKDFEAANRKAPFMPVREVSSEELADYKKVLKNATDRFVKKHRQIDKDTPFKNSSWVYDDVHQTATIVLWKYLASNPPGLNLNQIYFHLKQYLANEFQNNLTDSRAPHANFTHPDHSDQLFDGEYGDEE